jgi:hypothetical protein
LPRCLLLFWEDYLGVAPTIVNAARRFAELGVDVDIVTVDPSNQYPSSPALPRNVRVLQFWGRRHARRLVRWGSLTMMICRIIHEAWTRPYNFVVGFDCIIAAYVAVLAGVFGRAKLAYWSSEITGRHGLWIRAEDHKANRHTYCIEKLI